MHSDQKSSGVRRVIADIIELCELQWQLLTVDGQEAKRRAVKGVIYLMISLLSGIAATFAAVLAAGWLLHDQLGWSVGIALTLVSGVSIVITGLAGLMGTRTMVKANASLRETKEEFSENVRWIKQVVLEPHSSPCNQLRRGNFSPDLVDCCESRFQHLRR